VRVRVRVPVRVCACVCFAHTCQHPHTPVVTHLVLQHELDVDGGIFRERRRRVADRERDAEPLVAEQLTSQNKRGKYLISTCKVTAGWQ
jgi:hypothetical protein